METNNPVLYRKMCEPFESADAAGAAWQAFVDEVSVAREKHKITEVAIVSQFSYSTVDGEAVAGGSVSLGDVRLHEAMAATLLANIQKQRQDMIGKILAAGILRAAK